MRACAKVWWSVPALALALIGCPGSDEPGNATGNTGDTGEDVVLPEVCLGLTEPIVVSGVITEDTEWRCTNVVYRADGDIAVGGGATLTVGPGVTVEMPSQASLVVGNDSAGGAIVADGTLAPIRFTSTAAVKEAGQWEGILIDANATQAVFRNVTIAYAGDDTTDASVRANANLVVISEAEISDSTFMGSSRYGIQFTENGRAAGFSSNTFSENTGPSISMYANHLGTLSGSHAFGPSDHVEVVSDTVDASAMWANLGAPYLVIGDVLIEGTSAPAVVEIEAGTTFEVTAQTSVLVGNGGAGGLVASGTEANPIVWTSSQAVPEAGDWEGIQLDGNTTVGTFEWVEIHYGGDDQSQATVRTSAGLSVLSGANATITNSGFYNNDVDGIIFADGGGAVDFRNNDFLGNGQNAIRVEPNQIGDLSAPNTFGAGEVVRVEGGTASDTATWADLGAPYLLVNDVFVEGVGAPVVTVAPGANFRMAGQVALVVGSNEAGSFVADGGGAEAIVFTSADPVPQPGDWEALVFDGNTLNGVLDNVVVSYGGDDTSNYSGRGSSGVIVKDTSVSIQDSTFDANSVTGLLFQGTGAAASFGNNTFTNSAPGVGIALPANAVASLSGSHTFEAGDRVRIVGGTVTDSGTWANLGTAYNVVEDVFIEGPATPVVTVEAGSTFEMGAQVTLNVGWNAGGGLIANASGGNAITFTSNRAVPSAGDWEAVVVDGNATSSTAFDNVDFEYCGDDTTNSSERFGACLGIVGPAAPSVQNCAFSNSSVHGIQLRAGGTFSDPDTTNTFSAIGGENIRVD